MEDIYVAKWSPVSQSFVWAQRAGGPGADKATGIAVNGASVYVTGHFFGATATFGRQVLTNAASISSPDIFVAKLVDGGATGSFAWAMRAGGVGSELANGIAVSAANVYLTGWFDSRTIAFGTTVLTNAAASGTAGDGFVTKLTDLGSSAIFTWAQPFGGSNHDYAMAIAVNGGAVYATGSFLGPARFGSITLTSPLSGTVFVAKLVDAGSTGTFSWVQQVGGTSSAEARALAVNGPNVYVGGFYFGATAVFGSTTLVNTIQNRLSNEVFVAKLTDAGTTGHFVWAQSAGGTNDDMLQGLTVAGTNVYVTGWSYSPSITLGNTTLPNANPFSDDMFIARLADAGTSGRFVWALNPGGPGVPVGTSVAVHGSHIYLVGDAHPPTSFGNILVSLPTNASVAFLAALADPTLGIEPTAATDLLITLVPNPATSSVRITVPISWNGNASNITFTLLDALGRPLRRQTTPPAAAGTGVAFDVTGVPPGVYALRVQAGAYTATQKLVVE